MWGYVSGTYMVPKNTEEGDAASIDAWEANNTKIISSSLQLLQFDICVQFLQICFVFWSNCIISRRYLFSFYNLCSVSAIWYFFFHCFCILVLCNC
jgi:hypothetical protein